MDAVAETPTLRSLLRRTDLSLTLAGDERALEAGALDRPIRWVHSTDLADPTPFLAEGMALLTTGRQFLEGGEGAAFASDYVQRLVRRGLVALGFGTEVVRDGIPPALIAACAAQRLPLFEVPYRTPFIAVARANAEAIAARAYARRTWSLAAQRAISLAALRPDGLGATVAELARQLDTWVGLYDASGALSREHPRRARGAAGAGLHEQVAAVLRRGALAATSLRVGDDVFTVQTLGRGGHLRGALAVRSGELDQEARGVFNAVAAMTGLALEQNEGIRRERGLVRAAVLSSLLTDDAGLARGIAHDLWGALPPEPLVVAVADTQTDATAEWLEARSVDLGGALFFGRDGASTVIAVPASETAVLDEFAAAFDLQLGASAPVEYSGFSTGRAQAITAQHRGGGQVAHFGSLAGSSVLTALDTEAARALATAFLAPLRAHDAAHGSALITTVRTWLAEDARIDAAADALGMHRHTVRARLAQAEALLEVDLSSFPVRAELWAALVAAKV
ncbi:PucR family transcriptional regulator [Microbacterium fluvii]|uniref:PucR family transcriptional regulator n=1 Tax=Microbacterium fluvii TaxID=415215 RepID=A0ABW2HFA7_9MICO|nr:PucR family transcriptional regulator [Microbacterium fluvii]MCU4673451.1 PucR family transcriptional regulator [Microbacterium fluvii]